MPLPGTGPKIPTARLVGGVVAGASKVPQRILQSAWLRVDLGRLFFENGANRAALSEMDITSCDLTRHWFF